MRENILGQTEFDEVLWENVSTKILTDKYRRDYGAFIDALSFDMYKEYRQSDEDISIRSYSRILESFFHNLFHFDSSCEYVDEEILL